MQRVLVLGVLIAVGSISLAAVGRSSHPRRSQHGHELGGLAEYSAFNKDVVAWAQAQKAAGRTAAEAAQAFRAPEKYKGYSSTMGTLMGGLPGYIQRVYDGI